MSIHMPTLFDDEEYFVPPPKKESRKKKDQTEAKEAPLNGAEADAAADPVVPSEPVAEAGTQPVMDAEEVVTEIPAAEQPAEEVLLETPADIQAEPEAASTEVVADITAEETVESVETVPPAMDTMPEADAAINIPATADEATAEEIEAVVPEAATPDSNETEATPVETTEVVATASAPEQAITEAQIWADESLEPTTAETLEAPEEEGLDATEIVIEQSIELEQEEVEAENRAIDPFREIVEVSAVDELTVELPKAAPGITFEIPEEDETPAIELEMTARHIPTVREDKVDDLDQLMRTELISQDYTAFSGFSFEPEPEKKKIIPEPEAEVSAEASPITPEKEDIKLAVQEIDAAALDFEFESDALASSLPEFDLENKYYTIGEVAALFGVNVSHIRFWTTEFNLKVRTTRKGDRLYNPENIARLRLIHHLVKENGFTIKGAKDKLKHQKQNVSSQIDLKNKLSGLKDKLERIKKNL